MRKGRPRIDDCPIEGQPLTLVNGDSPCQFQWMLTKRAKYLFLHLLCFFVERVPNVLPFDWSDGDVCGIGLAAYEDFVAAETGDPANLAVKEPLFRSRVVPDEHHLRASFEFQSVLGRI